MKRLGVLLACALLSVVLLLAVLSFANLGIKTTAKNADGNWTSVEMPWVFPDPRENQVLRVDLQVNPFTPRVWQIIPDDDLRSIQVNGVELNLDTLPPGARGDWGKGFVFDFTSVLHRGHNQIDFVITNHGGPGGLALRPTTTSLYSRVLLAILAVLAFVPLLLGLAFSFRLRWFQLPLIICSLLPIAMYWSVTPYSVRTHDAVGPGGHFDYVVQVAEKLALPSPAAGWTFYHPPLYYVAGAAVYKVAGFFACSHEVALQAYSLGLWLLAIAAFAGTLRMALRGRPWTLAVATLALAFWPSAMIHSIRIGNDAMLVAMVAVTCFFFVRWWRLNRFADLGFMGLFGGLSFLSKTNASAVVAAMGCLVLWRLLMQGQRGRKPNIRGFALFSFLILTGLALSLANNIHSYSKGEVKSWFISNSDGLNRSLMVPVSVKAFLPLDVPTFVTEPWMSPWDDAVGRTNFWNYLLRTSLTGEFSFAGSKVTTVIAYLWGSLLLALFALALARGWPKSMRAAYRQSPWVLLAFFWVASLMVLRIKLPFACSNDFRYIWPVLVPALVWFARSGTAALWLLLAFVPLTTLFYLNM